MKIVIPMAGMGTRMRPHTLTIPKPLIPVAGKPIVQRLVEDIADVCEDTIEEIAFVIGRFGKEVEDNLTAIAQQVGAKASIYYQDEALGTAHAVYMAAESLSGNVIVAFADTLFIADFKLDKDKDAIIWVQQVEDPSAFGVVKLNEQNKITDFVEKPQEFVSDLAIIGIYYFKDGANLCNELKYLIDNDINVKGEYQLTDALENMKNKGVNFVPGQVTEWLDCGNKNATVETNQRVLHNKGGHQEESVCQDNAVIVHPCYIGDNVSIINSVVGPYVSIGDGTVIEDTIIKNAIVQNNSVVESSIIENTMIGNNARVSGNPSELSVGDYNVIE